MRYRNGNVINEYILHDSDMSNILFNNNVNTENISPELIKLNLFFKFRYHL